jgi:hypothetical protein
MDKFISIPATNLGSLIVSASGIAGVAQASTTTVVITYKTGLVATITHATAGSSVETQTDAIVSAIESALQTPWTVPTKAIAATDLPFAVSAIAFSLLIQAAS